jgi:predicted peptidase
VESEGGFPQQPGIHRQVLPPRNLRYTIAIPSSYRSGQPASLVMALHFGGGSTPYYGGVFLDALVGPALGELDAIFVAPDAMTGTWSSPEAETNLLELLDALRVAYGVEPRRTLLTGYSLGGSGTWYLASRNQKRFAAALPMSGRPVSNAAGIDWEIPLYVIHSRQDEVVPFGPTETVVNQLKARGVSVELAAVEGITHYETSRFAESLHAAIPWIRQAWR